MRSLAFALVILGISPATPAQVVISEFLASNRNGLRDKDGDTSDWIEVEARGSVPIDVSGWYLTDDADDRTKWRVPVSPDHVLAPGERLVIFASGKNRDGAELHASFSLRREGEYLALVEPDGVTIAHEYAPEYPGQREDISYGLARRTETVVDGDSRVDVLVPTDGSLGTGWTDPTFIAGAAWTRDARLGLGFQAIDGEEVPEGLLSYWSFDGDLEDSIRGNDGVFRGAAAPAYVEGFDGSSATAVHFDGIDDYVEVTGRAGLPLYGHRHFSVAMWVKGSPQPDKRVFSEGSSTNNTPVFNIGTDVSGRSGNVDIFVRSTSGTAHAHTLSAREPFDSTWRHLAWVDRAGQAELWIDGALDETDFDYTRPAMSLDRTSIGAILRAESSFHFRGAIDEVSLWSRALSEDEVLSLAGDATPLTLGSSAYAARIATDLESAMLGVNTSAYLRVSFSVKDPVEVDSLVLRTHYDDGFVAYLNGVEVTRRNAPVSPSWSSAAMRDRDAGDVAREERIGIPALPGTLGTVNILAIHALNSSLEDPEFLFAATLEASSVLDEAPRYFTTPTPGAANTGGSGLVRDTAFSFDRGFHNTPFDVEITTDTEGAEIRYTLDGSAPTADNGFVYRGPIPIDSTTTLRAAAFLDGSLPTNVDTQTYVFLADVVRQRRPSGYPTTWSGFPADYDMDPEIVGDPRYGPLVEQGFRAFPSVSIVMDVEDLFGSNGIYQNPTRSGRAWERPGSVELIYPDGSRGFQEDAGVRISGNRSRDPGTSPKHGFRVVFRGEYGSRKLEFPLFPDSPVTRFDTLIVRPNIFDSWVSSEDGTRDRATYIRDHWVRVSQRDTSQPTVHGLFVHLWLNGRYWGVYNLTERPDASFGEEYFGGDKDEYDAIKNHEEVVDGSLTAYSELVRRVSAGISSDAAYARVEEYLDVDNMIDYMIVNMYAPATDWPGNYYMLRRRSPAGRFRMFSWDSERAFHDGVSINRTLPHRRDADSPTKFYHPLRANAEFRLLFADHLQRHLFHDGILTPSAAAGRWLRISAEIETALVCESARWGDYRRATPYTPDGTWLVEQDALLTDYFPRRTAILLEQFRDQDLYPPVDAPVFHQHGGAIDAGFELRLGAGGGTIVYTLDGTDPRRRGGGVSDGARELDASSGAGVLLDRTTLVKARTRSGEEWSALSEALFVVDSSALRITELMYHPASADEGSPFGNEAFEFVELQNVGEVPLNLSGMRFSAGIEFTFPPLHGPSTDLAPGEVVLIVRDLEAFEERYSSSPFDRRDDDGLYVAGEYQRGLDNGGELIVLEDVVGRVVLDFVYSDSWYPLTDGVGSSLEIVDAAAEPARWRVREGWRASAEPGGSPGFVREQPSAGLQLAGDLNQDSALDVSDAIALMGHLFLGTPAILPCGDGGLLDSANRTLLDATGDARVDLSDPIRILGFLFGGSGPPVLGTDCVEIEACPDACGGSF